MFERITSWLRDDTPPEDDQQTAGKGWGLSLSWGAVVVALFTIAISLCHEPDDVSAAATSTPPASTEAPSSPPPTLAPPGSPNLGELIAERDDLTFFNSLIATAGIGEVLSGDGLFTFFAPTDDVFAALPSDVLDLVSSNPQIADQILQRHATFGPASAANLLEAGRFATVNGEERAVTETDGMVLIDQATVTEADLLASNGVVHVIDGILGEPIGSIEAPAQPIGDLLLGREDLSTLVTALRAVEGGELNIGPDGFTVFAPTNNAFDALPSGSLQVLVTTQPKLLELLGYHIFDGNILSSDLTDGLLLTASSGAEAVVSVTAAGISVGGATITEADIIGIDGVIHIVNGVLRPPGFQIPPLNEALGLEPVTFETSSSVITQAGRDVLAGAVEFLAANSDVLVTIEGHTDSQGGEVANGVLSRSRAAAVRDYLVSQGIAADRLEVAGFGETRPIADNDTPEGRAQNRRIEFRLR